MQRAEAHRAALLAALRDANDIEVDCSKATEVDVSLLQLLVAAHRSASEQGKSLRLWPPANGVLLDALVRGGFVDPALPPASNGFWLNPRKDPQ